MCMRSSGCDNSARMERLLAYEGPAVHVDHAHRAPAPTSWSSREKAVSEATAKCNAYNRELEDEVRTLQRQLAAEKDQVERERQHKQAAKKKHEWAVDEMTKEADGRMKAEAALQAKEEELARSRRTHKAAINRLADETVDDEAEKRRLEAEVERLELRLAEAAELIDQLAAAAGMPKAAPAPEAVPAPKPAPPKPSVKDKERGELTRRIQREEQYVNDWPSREGRSELLTLLSKRRDELDATPDDAYKYTSETAKFDKLDETAKAKAKELWRNYRNEDMRQGYNQMGGGHGAFAGGANALYKLERLYLYVLYGGWPLPEKL